MLTTFVMCHVFQLNVFFKTCQPPLLIMGRLFFFFFHIRILYEKGRRGTMLLNIYTHFKSFVRTINYCTQKSHCLQYYFCMCFFLLSLFLFLPFTIFLHLSISGGYVEGCKDVKGFCPFYLHKREIERIEN